MDPITGSAAFNGFILSNCLRRLTNHQSTINIANAIILTEAHSPTYLKFIEITLNDPYNQQ